MIRFFLVSILLIFFSTSLVKAQSYHEVLEDVAIENQLIGMSVVLVCEGEILDIYHYGKANLVNDIAISDSTIYRIASISKSVTATVLMKLYEQGMFDLDDDINDYMGYSVRNPNFPNQKISFRMLLSHKSSLQDGTGYTPFLAATFAQLPVPPISNLLLPTGNAYTSDMWRTEAPGTYFNYSNINYGLIATLVEKIAGQRFDQYAKEAILEPLGITGSYYVNDLPNINNVATLYRNSVPQSDNYNGIYPAPLEANQYTIGDNGIRSSPHGGLRASAIDLSKFMRMHANNGSFNGTSILDSTTVALMHEVQWSYDGNNGNNYFNLFNEWSLGLHSVRNTANGDIVLEGTKMLGHPGEAYGLISDMYFEKEHQFGLIFLTNGYAGSDGYSFGTNSAYYVPEEKIFEAIKSYQFENCTSPTTSTLDLANSNTSSNASLFYASNTKQLYFNGAFDHGKIYSISGQLVRQFSINTPSYSVADLQIGLYLIVVQTKTGDRAQKLVVLH